MAAYLAGAQIQSPGGLPQGATVPPKAPSVVAPEPPYIPAVERVVKDGFSMPTADYVLIEAAVERALNHRIVMSKSGILRAAIQVLSALDEDDFRRAVAAVEEIKPGRKKTKRL